MIIDTDVLEWELVELLNVSEDMTLSEMYSNSDKPGEHPEPSELYTDLRYKIRVISTLSTTPLCTITFTRMSHVRAKTYIDRVQLPTDA